MVLKDPFNCIIKVKSKGLKLIIMKKASIAEVRKYLKSKNEKELEDLIVNLYKNNSEIQKQITFQVQGDNYGLELLEDYKQKIDKEFNRRSKRFSMRTLNSYLSSFRKEVNNNPELYADLLLFYCEKMIEIFNEYEYSSESEENNLFKKFESLSKILKKDQKLFEKLHSRILKMLQNYYLNNYDLISWLLDPYAEIPWVSDEELESLEENT